jgi:hypothetical protein
MQTGFSTSYIDAIQNLIDFRNQILYFFTLIIMAFFMERDPVPGDLFFEKNILISWWFYPLLACNAYCERT